MPLWQRGAPKRPAASIQTGAAGLNRLLRGGLQSGRVTDVYGESGAGKSQFAFDVTVRAVASSGASVVFVDTTKTFRPERVAEIAEANALEKDTILAKVAVFRPRSSGDQLNVFQRVRDLTNVGRVALLVVDTITELFLQDYQGDDRLIERQSALARHTHDLALHAAREHIPVLITNGVRSRPREGLVEIAASALSCVHVRLQLTRTGSYREARLLAEGKVHAGRFRITPAGLAD